MVTWKTILSHLPSGRVLDVATGNGGFVHCLLEGLSASTEIIGIDTTVQAASAFAAAFAVVRKEHPTVRYREMDATCLEFESESFDLVCVSNSLHHFEKPEGVLAEMKRVLRPGGWLLVSEMVRDGQTEPQQTHVELHHWWAAIDRAMGLVHNETYPRRALIALVDALDLEGLVVHDRSETDQDPRDPEVVAALEPVIDRYLVRAAGHPELLRQGEWLRQRLRDIGFQNAASVVVMGRKGDGHSEDQGVDTVAREQ